MVLSEEERAGRPAPFGSKNTFTLADVRGAVRLATQATTGVTRIVEGVHSAVGKCVGMPTGATPGRTRGITGLVYRSVHGSALLIGRSLELSLMAAEQLTDPPVEPPSSPARLATVAILNGVLGDHLAAEGNPLALTMTFHHAGRRLDWTVPPLNSGATEKVVLLIHGLCLSEESWRSTQARNHVAALAAHGYTPVYLRYNTGLHISSNGQELAAQLERLVQNWPTRLAEITVVAHSMGGLVMRSALHYAARAQLQWPAVVKNIVFLGVPHHGAPLERAGHWLDGRLASTPFTAPFTALGRVRSAGITDLRHGYLTEEEWRGRSRFSAGPDRSVVPLPPQVACYAVAANRATTRCAGTGQLLADHLLGDGLVPVPSALGRHSDVEHSLEAGLAEFIVLDGMHHFGLLHDPTVTAQLVRWLAS